MSDALDMSVEGKNMVIKVDLSQGFGPFYLLRTASGGMYLVDVEKHVVLRRIGAIWHDLEITEIERCELGQPLRAVDGHDGYINSTPVVSLVAMIPMGDNMDIRQLSTIL